MTTHQDSVIDTQWKLILDDLTWLSSESDTIKFGSQPRGIHEGALTFM